MMSENKFWEKMAFIPDTQVLHILASKIREEAYEAPLPPAPPQLAQSCLQAAADMGDTEAMMQLGLIAVNAGDSQAGYAWYCKAAEAGNGEGLFCVGRAHLFGDDGEEKNPAVALEWYKRSGDAGYAEGYWGIGEIYHYGRTGTVDMEKACYWYGRAAEGGDLKSMYAIGEYYDTLSRNAGNDDERQRACEKSLYWLMRAAEQGDRRALSSLAETYYAENKDRIIKPDHKKAIVLIQHNLKNTTNIEEIVTLGYYYETGLGCTKNNKLAALLYSYGLESGWGFFDGEGLHEWRDRQLFETHLEEISVLGNKDVNFLLSGLARLSKDTPAAREYLETQFFQHPA